MNKKNYKKIFIVSIIAIIFLFFLRGSNAFVKKPNSTQQNQTSTEIQKTISATIIADDETITFTTKSGATLYETLKELDKTGILSFFGRNYPRLGFFVTDIGGLHSGNGKNLMYYINDKEAVVGVSSYILKNGDIVEWKLK